MNPQKPHQAPVWVSEADIVRDMCAQLEDSNTAALTVQLTKTEDKTKFTAQRRAKCTVFQAQRTSEGGKRVLTLTRTYKPQLDYYELAEQLDDFIVEIITSKL